MTRPPWGSDVFAGSETASHTPPSHQLCVVQGPFAVAPCQIVRIVRFATNKITFCSRLLFISGRLAVPPRWNHDCAPVPPRRGGSHCASHCASEVFASTCARLHHGSKRNRSCDAKRERVKRDTTRGCGPLTIPALLLLAMLDTATTAQRLWAAVRRGVRTCVLGSGLVVGRGKVDVEARGEGLHEELWIASGEGVRAMVLMVLLVLAGSAVMLSISGPSAAERCVGPSPTPSD